MIPFIYFFYFINGVVIVNYPPLNKPLVYEDKCELKSRRKKPFIRFPCTFEYFQGKKYVTIMEIKF